MAFSISRSVLPKLKPASVHCLKLGGLECSASSHLVWARSLASAALKYESLLVTNPHKHVLHVELNRPEKRNSLNKVLWREYRECFNEIKKDKECRAVVVSGAGKMFTAGLDFMDMGEMGGLMGSDDDVARKALMIQEMIADYQDSFTVMEKCTKPVIAAVHNGCIGAGLDMISAADIRYCTEDAYFQVKEVDIGMAADVGTLQRFPRIVGNDSLVRELVYTGRKLNTPDAVKLGLVSGVFPTKEELLKAALELAQLIASKSPVAVQGSKVNLVYSRDHSVPESLHFMTHWNMSMLQSEDLMKAALAAMNRESKQPEFSDL